LAEAAMTEALFNGGPPLGLYRWLRLRSSDGTRVRRLAIAAVLASWLPLAVLAAAAGNFISWAGPGPFLHDIAVHARYLIAVPLLIVAEPGCVAVLSELARHFWESGLVAESDRERFDAVLQSTGRLRDARFAEIAVITVGYAIIAAVFYSVSPQRLPAWHTSLTAAGHLSAAGWWHVLVSAPLLVILLLAWCWRLFLWVRFLWLVSRLDLKLLPAHPDRAAGLRFVGYSINALAPFGTALGVIAAGMIANRVTHDAASLLSYKFVAVGLAAFVVVVTVAPLLAFVDKLLAAWDFGVLGYGALTNRLAAELEHNWIGRTAGFTDNPLHTQTAAALTSMGTLSSNVYAMRFVPLDPRSIIVIIVMTLLPFLPVILMVLPLDVVIKDLAKYLI
jgi:hypothetical protein